MPRYLNVKKRLACPAAIDAIDYITLMSKMGAQRLARCCIDLVQASLGINTWRVSFKSQFSLSLDLNTDAP